MLIFYLQNADENAVASTTPTVPLLNIYKLNCSNADQHIDKHIQQTKPRRKNHITSWALLYQHKYKYSTVVLRCTQKTTPTIKWSFNATMCFVCSLYSSTTTTPATHNNQCNNATQLRGFFSISSPSHGMLLLLAVKDRFDILWCDMTCTVETGRNSTGKK